MSETDTILIDDGRICVHREFVDQLCHNRLEHFDAVMAFRRGQLVRVVPGRTTMRIELPSPVGPPLVAYLKRYEPDQVSSWDRLLRRLGRHERHEAAREWRMVHALRTRGFHTATPIAAGKAPAASGSIRSFVMTAEIHGGLAADVFWQSQDRPGRDALITALASLTRQFHSAGFIHKDYYLPHIFVVQRDGILDLYLIDLQRVMGPGRFRQRWMIKDLGGLAFSAERAGISRTDMLRFYKKCFQVNRLDARDKKRIRKICARLDRIRRHTPRHGASPIVSQPCTGAQTS
jgi:UDP-glucose:(heptosyl)LPS alpha-1,3-glucosyltransferase/heptose I phosphotransferase